MSTRYVWGRYKIGQSITYGSAENVSMSPPSDIRFYRSGNAVIQGAELELQNEEDFTDYALSTAITTVNLNGYYWYCYTTTTRWPESGLYYGGRTQLVSQGVGQAQFWQLHIRPGQLATVGVGQGPLQGYTSAAASSAYPTDGVSGSYWYEYQGSDSIDARGCSIPSSIMGGSQIQISVTPSNTKVYGGNVSYIYQVKLGGGAWQTIQTTTAESINYTVPLGTTTFQARVRAKDNLGFTSTDYTTSSEVTVVNNQPPTAPGSIDVANVVSGQTATITLTAATDPDGTIASYIYERSVDGQAWEQIANVNSLTQTDQVSAEWGTVAYRAKAVDDDGGSGPYVTSTTQVVNSGWVILAGPSPSMGEQSAPFNFQITPSISGESTADQIAVSIMLDGKSIYSDSVAQGVQISVEIDTRTMTTGNHSIAVSATCAEYIPAAAEYTFSVPVVPLNDGGRLDQLEAPDGQAVFPVTLARAVLGIENYGIEQKVHPGAYTGTGTFGSDNQVTLNFDFAPQLVLIQGTDGRTGILTRPSGIGASIGATESSALTVTWGELSVSWYSALSAAVELNTADQTYSYTAFG